MPHWAPISRRNLIRALRDAGFSGPFTGGKHAFMTKGEVTVTIPNPHRGDIGREFLARILRQAEITREEWETLS